MKVLNKRHRFHFALDPISYGACPAYDACSMFMLLVIEMAQRKVRFREVWKIIRNWERTCEGGRGRGGGRRAPVGGRVPPTRLGKETLVM